MRRFALFLIATTALVSLLTRVDMRAATADAPAKSPEVVPFLWFEKDAEVAAKFYCSLFPNSVIERESKQAVTFRLNGRTFMALNGGPHYRLSPAYSMFVTLEDQAEVDRYWDALLRDGGKPDRCGWLVDRFGLSWQILPKRLVELLEHRDPEIRRRAAEAMMEMQKIDVAELERAVGG
jgi:predicted 3-demethylubiquinone-9 3-methyltransferase (glyoxalase superfamily)